MEGRTTHGAKAPWADGTAAAVSVKASKPQKSVADKADEPEAKNGSKTSQKTGEYKWDMNDPWDRVNKRIYDAING